MTQPALFGELLPALEGCIEGIVGKRPAAHGRHEWDLQCQHCYSIETVFPLVIMTYQFPHCQDPRRRLCPDCHKQLCDGTRRCRGMPGMRGHYD